MQGSTSKHDTLVGNESVGIRHRTKVFISVGFIRVDSGAALTASIKDQRQAVFLTEGSVSCNGRGYATRCIRPGSR